MTGEHTTPGRSGPRTLGGTGGILQRSLRATVDGVLRHPVAERFALRHAGHRMRTITLVWHRVSPQGPARHEVVPTVATATFVRQLDVIARLGRIVPLAEIEDAVWSDEPLFALTFDDDDPGHVLHTLPVLMERCLPATFFLSGRWRYGCGPYWWEILESAIRRHGADAVAEHYGLPRTMTPPRIAAALAGTAAARELADGGQGRSQPGMRAHDAAAMVAAGMEVGFHTVDHPVLPLLDTNQVHAAVQRGRSELSAELSAPVVRLAYPHGQVDRRVADVVRTLGYTSAWTTSKHVGAPSDDAMMRGRWDIGASAPPVVRARLVRALARAAA